MKGENIVVDTNSLIQIIPRKSRYNAIWQAIRRGDIHLCVSNEIIEEYEEILFRLTNAKTTRAVIEAIINNPQTIFITPYYRFNLITADPDDNKFVDCAITASAKCLVTEDNHYNVLKRISFPKVVVVGLDEFLAEFFNA